MNERIKKLRKALDLTQQAFADRLGIRQNTIAKYETNRGTPTTSVISLIVREFNVSETWLRTGEGEMFNPAPDGLLGELARKYGLSDRSRIIVERFLALKPDVQETVADYIESIAATFKENASPPVVDSKMETTTQTEPDIMSELAELKRQNAEIQRQNQELSARLSAMEEEDELGWPSDAGNLA